MKTTADMLMNSRDMNPICPECGEEGTIHELKFVDEDRKVINIFECDNSDGGPNYGVEYEIYSSEDVANAEGYVTCIACGSRWDSMDDLVKQIKKQESRERKD